MSKILQFVRLNIPEWFMRPVYAGRIYGPYSPWHEGFDVA